MGVGGRFARPGPYIRSVVRAIIDAVSGFSSVSCLETWRIPVPRIRDRLHRIEPCSPNSRPGVEPEGLSLALPMVAPEDTFAAVGASLASAPRTPWSECALHTGRFLTSAAWFLWNWPQLHHAPVCHCKLAGRFPRAASQDVSDLAPGSRCVSHRAVLWLICRPVGAPPLHSSSP